MRLDLHVHTTASDGACTPGAVVGRAVAGGLDVIAVTDHDTTAGVGPAQEAAASTPLTVVSGTELSSTHETHDIHVLGYGVDPDHPAIDAHRRRARRLRLDRMKAMLERLSGLGIHLTMEAVLEEVGPEGEMVGRPHLARALVAAGAVGDVREAFDRHISDDGPAFVPTDLQTPAEAVATIRAAGGVPVWAHPPRSVFEELLGPLIDAGLEGLEVLRPYNSAAWTKTLRAAARRHGLVVSGGSDWHGPDRRALGGWWVTDRQLCELLARLGIDGD
jgi:hypothetical protein